MTEKVKDDLLNTEADEAAAALDAVLEDATTLRASATNVDDKAIRRTRTIATIVLIILILIILAACLMLFALLRPGGLQLDGRQHAGITWIRSIYGHGLDLDGQINPSSVFFDPSGDSVWITDSARFRLVQYDLNGRLMQIIHADWRVNEMIFPSRITISPKGWHYVAEQTYNRVQIFDENWNHVETIHIQEPVSVSANDERLAIGARRGFAVFTYYGGPIGMHASDVAEDPETWFDYVHGLYVDRDNNTFVVDTFNNRLIKFNPMGESVYVQSLGHPGNQGILGGRDVTDEEAETEFPANMQLPKGITMDAAGRLNIIDMFDFSVAIFNAETGEFIRKVGQHGIEDGRFFNPNCIDYNPHRDMFATAEASLGRVQLFSIEGSSADPLAQARRQLSDFLNACCIPLIIILIILAAYLISRYLTRKRREKEMTAALADSTDPDSEGVVDAAEVDSTSVQQT